MTLVLSAKRFDFDRLPEIRLLPGPENNPSLSWQRYLNRCWIFAVASTHRVGGPRNSVSFLAFHSPTLPSFYLVIIDATDLFIRTSSMQLIGFLPRWEIIVQSFAVAMGRGKCLSATFGPPLLSTEQVVSSVPVRQVGNMILTKIHLRYDYEPDSRNYFSWIWMNTIYAATEGGTHKYFYTP